MVYRLLSLKRNELIIIKTRVGKKTHGALGGSLWKSADFQEREIYDLFGIRFEGHPACGASCSGRLPGTPVTQGLRKWRLRPNPSS